MSETSKCPTEDQWRRHLDGSLPPETERELTEHLGGCPTCQKSIELLAGGETLLKVAGQSGNVADEPALRDVMASATKTGAMPAENDLPFLSPPTTPGHLGRLGQYAIVRRIGRGGFGQVFEAFDEKLRRLVAIKVLAPELAASASARKRFIREAQAVAAIRNERVVAIYDVQDQHQPPYLAMEFIPGPSLQERLDVRGSFQLAEILRIGMQIAEGLAAAHEQGIIHRDIKPANILLENGVERVKITDFGLARVRDDASLTQSGAIAGTPAYMSPEQANGLNLDARSDLFSLGSVLYALAAGHAPFRAPTTMAVLLRVAEATARPIRSVNPDIPEWFADVIDRLHAKKPADRFASAEEVAQLLRRGLAHVQDPDTMPSPVTRSGRRMPAAAPARPWRAAWWIGGLALLAAVLFCPCMVAGYVLLSFSEVRVAPRVAPIHIEPADAEPEQRVQPQPKPPVVPPQPKPPED